MKKIVIRTLSILVVSMFVSCAAVIQPISSTQVVKNNVEINSEYSQEIGSPLVVKGQLRQRKAIRIENVEPFKISLVPFPYSEGAVLPLMGENKTWLFYYDNSQNIYQLGIVKSKRSGELRAFINSASSGFTTKIIPTLEVSEESVVPEGCNDCFQQEFVFNGRVGDNLKFLYREYSSNLIRADFSQELQYDINESNIVGFRGLRLEILKTTNTNIRFKVLSSFD